MTMLWLASALAPLATVAALGLTGFSSGRTSRIARERISRLAPLAVLPAGALALAAPGAGMLTLPGLLLGTNVSVDALAAPLLLLAVMLYGAALVAVGSAGGARAPLLTAVLLICFTGNAGVFVAADTVTFYLFFTVMSFAGFGLVIHERTAEAQRAARIYLVMAVLGEGAVIAGLLLVDGAGGLMLADAPASVAASPDRAAIVALLLVGFGVKAGTVPLHVWLPLAHPAAPAPASAVLSGVMLTAGIMGWLRFFPLGEVALPDAGELLVLVALLGAFLAVPAGVLQSDPKVVLAYSSISQMGFLGVLIGIALAEPQLAEACVLATVLYAVHHGVAKGALFLAVPLWKQHGAGRARIALLVGLASAALAIAGAPLTSGYLAKYAAKEAVDGAQMWGIPLVVLLPLVGTGSVLLLARAGWLLLRGPASAVPFGPALVSWLLLLALGFGVTFALAVGWDRPLAVPSLVDARVWWDQGWPVVLGVLLAAVGWGLSRREVLPRWAGHLDGRAVPPGDIVVVEERVLRRLAGSAGSAGSVLSDAGARVRRAARRLPSPFTAILAGETRLGQWRISGLALLALLLLGLLLILRGVP